MLLSKSIRLFLESIGRKEEYEFYLEKFHAQASGYFGGIVPDTASMEQSLEVVLFDLEFLRKLELHPLLLLCGPGAAPMKAALDGCGHAIHYLAADTSALDRTAINVRYAPDGDRVDRLLACLPDTAPRIHFMRLEGPFQGLGGDRINYHYIRKPCAYQLSPGDQAYVEDAARILQQRPASHISVSSPIHLLRELFTVKGAGTIIRTGSLIHHTMDAADVDVARLVALLQDSFGKILAHPGLLEHMAHYYIEADYRGAALMEQHTEGAYLSKFAVGTQARGEGLAKELWEAVLDNHPALFWRSRDTNPVNSWYDDHADGKHRTGGWNVYWRGVETGHISNLIAFCTSRPSDFVEG